MFIFDHPGAASPALQLCAFGHRPIVMGEGSAVSRCRSRSGTGDPPVSRAHAERPVDHAAHRTRIRRVPLVEGRDRYRSGASWVGMIEAARLVRKARCPERRVQLPEDDPGSMRRKSTQSPQEGFQRTAWGPNGPKEQRRLTCKNVASRYWTPVHRKVALTTTTSDPRGPKPERSRRERRLTLENVCQRLPASAAVSV